MLEQPQTQISAVLGGFVKQQTRKFEDERSLDSKQMLQKHGGLIGAQSVQQDLKKKHEKTLIFVKKIKNLIKPNLF